MRLKDKVAVITGAAQGIGLASAERFKAEGAKLMLSDINEATGRAAAEGLDAPFIRCDAGVKSDVEALIARGRDPWARRHHAVECRHHP
jgi:NAD(P)-dependent dehydrogenase (short-subunit alcohol dehydrogenase family)